MKRNFTVCPHCAATGKQRLIRPATPRTPLISRSDSRSFHLFLEESNVSRPSGAPDQEVAALFRYDLDSAGEKSDSILLTIRPAECAGGLMLMAPSPNRALLPAILD